MYMNMRTPLFSLDRTSTHLRLYTWDLSILEIAPHTYSLKNVVS